MEDEPTTPIPPKASGGTGPYQPPGAAPPPPSTPPPPASWTPPAPAQPARPNRLTGVIGHRATGWIVAALLVGAVTGLSVALANASSSPAPVAVRSPAKVPPARIFRVPSGASGFFPGASGRLGNVVIGRVGSVSSSSFTITSATGAVVKVDEQPSTTYRDNGVSATKTSVKTGDEVFVLGSRSGSTVKASRVIIVTAGGGGFFPG